MNYEINEVEFYSVDSISQIDKYQTDLQKGSYDDGFYKTALTISLTYFNTDLVSLEKDITLPIELNIGVGNEVSIELNNVDIEVIENLGVNINYSVNVLMNGPEIVDYAFEQEPSLDNLKDSVVESYEELIENQFTRNDDSVVVNEIDNEEFCELKLQSDTSKIKVIFNVTEAKVDEIAKEYNITVSHCYKLMSTDKSKVIIPLEQDNIVVN